MALVERILIRRLEFCEKIPFGVILVVRLDVVTHVEGLGVLVVIPFVFKEFQLLL